MPSSKVGLLIGYTVLVFATAVLFVELGGAAAFAAALGTTVIGAAIGWTVLGAAMVLTVMVVGDGI